MRQHGVTFSDVKLWKKLELCRSSLKAIASLVLSNNEICTQHLIHTHKIVTFST